jgi:hypothetical protein
MKRIIWLPLIIYALFVQHAFATPPPMVEKHIFTPSAESEKETTIEAAKAINPKELQRQIIFSGVITGPKGKKAMLRDSGKPADVPKAEAGKTDAVKQKLYAVGEQIKGMTIKDIGSNYVILAGQEGETKLNLFRGEKARPAAPVIAQESTAQPPQAQQHPPGTPGGPASPGDHAQGPANEPGGPGAIGPPSPDRTAPSNQPDAGAAAAGTGSDAPPPNPFAEVLKKAAERRANRAEQPSSGGGMSNPFMNLQQ